MCNPSTFKQAVCGWKMIDLSHGCSGFSHSFIIVLTTINLVLIYFHYKFLISLALWPMSLSSFLSWQTALYSEESDTLAYVWRFLSPLYTITNLAVLHTFCVICFTLSTNFLQDSRHLFKLIYSHRICIRHDLLALWLPLYTTCYRFKIWEIHLYFSAWKKIHMCSRRCEVNAGLPVSWFYPVRDWLFHPYKRKLCGSLCRLSTAGRDL